MYLSSVVVENAVGLLNIQHCSCHDPRYSPLIVVDPGFVGPKACASLGLTLRNNKIEDKSEYAFRVRTEIARSSEGPCGLSFLSITVNVSVSLDT